MWVHLTDPQFSTLVVLELTGSGSTLVEYVEYDAYGHARHIPWADADGDGTVNLADQTMVIGAWGSPGLNGGNVTRDGLVDLNDLLAIINNWGQTSALGTLSGGTTDNIIGYAGYVYNAEFPRGGLYTVRHRHYSVDLGRWISRDPAGYVDGWNLYGYVNGRPLVMFDPYGLYGWDPFEWIGDRIAISGAAAKGFYSSLWENTGGAIIEGVAFAGSEIADHTKFQAAALTGDMHIAMQTRVGQRLAGHADAGAGPTEAVLRTMYGDHIEGIANGFIEEGKKALDGDLDAICMFARLPGEALVPLAPKGLQHLSKMKTARAASKVDDVAASTPKVERAAQLDRNRTDGAAREARVQSRLEGRFGSDNVQSQQLLRNADGSKAIDPRTGTGRRMDHVIIQNGQGRALIETTSKTARKRAQLDKQQRIRNSGGHFVRDRVTGELIDVREVMFRLFRIR